MSRFEEQDFTKFNFKTWRKLLRHLIPLRKFLILAGIAVIVLGILDVLFPFMTKIVIDQYIGHNDLEGLKRFAVLLFMIALTETAGVYLFIRMAGKIEVELSYRLRKQAFEHLQGLSFNYFNKTPVGWIMSRLTSDATRLSEIISWGLIDLCWGVLMMIGVIIAMFIVNVKLALITLSIVPPLTVLTLFIRRKILYVYREVRRLNSKITGAFNEGIMGAKTTKTLVIEEKNNREFESLTSSMKARSIHGAIISAFLLPTVLVISFIGTSLAIYFGGKEYLAGAIQIGVLQLFINFSMQFFDPVMIFSRIFAELQQAQAAAERIISLLETEPEIVDRPDVIEVYGDYLHFKRENWEPIKGDITFENVDFWYEEGEPILENFNLEVKAGETIALVGETGAGKSTIVNLVCRFFEPRNGRILIDGKDYRDRSLGWLHANIGYVLQTPHLFSGTIRDNIRYGKLDATEEEIIQAAKLVNAHDFIMQLEKGYDTEVGEGGAKLSVGQKQLISFARAIIADPKIIILDEATSSIDTETERMIQQAIETLLKGRTSFIIAHRLSTIVNADHIIVIRDGKIVEQGNHSSLIQKKGYYYRLYTNQFVEEQVAELFSASSTPA